MTGRIDVHTHLLPGIDDGCANLEQAITCARMLAKAGFTHAFCTPHLWPNSSAHTAAAIARLTEQLQRRLDAAEVAVRVLPGAEIGLRPEVLSLSAEDIVGYGLDRSFCLIDLWADSLPSYFDKAIQHLRTLGFQPVLAHPERMQAVQDDPTLGLRFHEMGVLLQGNLPCLCEPVDSASRKIAEQFLVEGRYTFLATDTHQPDTMAQRLQGMRRAVELVGQETVDRLTIHNPRMLLPQTACSRGAPAQVSAGSSPSQ